MQRVVVGVFSVVALMLSASARPHAGELPEGAALYQEQCSVCHGMIASEAKHRFHSPPYPYAVHPLRARTSEYGLTKVLGRMTQGPVPLDVVGRSDMPPVATDHRVVVVPPYGPPLRGVIGRLAGSVEGFAYSQAFRRILQGVTWNHDTVDRWITDSQAWVPGSMMLYEQPDPEIRRKIITYLEANR